MSRTPLLVVVTGPPASGKTTLARELAVELRLPLLAKDDVKEQLFDSLGTGDRAWSRALGSAAFEVLFRVSSELLRSGTAHLLEGNFGPESEASLRGLPPHRPLQILCTAPRDVLLQRFGERASGGARHIGHLDEAIHAEVAAGLRDRRWPALQLGGEPIVVDTTAPPDVGRLAATVHEAL
jgi:predicted kinase